MVHFLKKILSYLSKYELKDIIGFITSTIAIVAFLIAVDYFTARSSLNISMSITPTGYYMDSLINYYHDNGIELPKQFYEDASLRKLFYKATKQKENYYINLNDGVSDEALIRALHKGQIPGSHGMYLQRRINMLENQIGKYTYKKHIYTSTQTDLRGHYDEKGFKPILDHIKSILSKEDYYTFLAALIRSRERRQSIYVKNDGHLDLKNIKITIPAPLSRVTESRANNLLEYQLIGKLLHKIINDTSKLSLYLPSLKKEEFVLLQIVTKENQIKEEEIFSSYERDNVINRRQIFLYFIAILIGMFILSILLKGRPAESGSRGFFSPSPHNTLRAGPHRAFHQGYRAVAG